MKTLVCVRLGACTLLMVFLESCSFGGRFAYDAIDYNNAVEKAANAQILLNVLRAKDRKPMHFSTISQLRGGHTISSTGGLSFSLPFGGEAASAYTASPSLSITRSTSPSFDVAVSDNPEFHQGILQPIKMEVLAFYWQQRWPQELLLHLFIHKVEKSTKTKDAKGNEKWDKEVWLVERDKVDRDWKGNWKNEESLTEEEKEKRRECENAPEYPGYKCFRDWVEDILAEKGEKQLSVGSIREGRGIGPILSREEVSDLKKLVGVETAKLRVIPVSCPTDAAPTRPSGATGPTKPVSARYRLFNVTESAAFCFGQCEDQKLGELKKEDCEKGLQETTSVGTATTQTSAQIGQQTLVKKEGKDKEGKYVETKYVIHLRSVQGILYHLGELLRVQGTEDEVKVNAGHGPKKDLISLFRLDTVGSLSAGDSPLAVEYDGKVYMVPAKDSESGLTKTAMSLVVQLLGLNKTGKELPKTTAVEVVGGR